MALPACFGVYWEAIPSNKQCSEQCGAKKECLHRFATVTLAKYQAELGDQATPARLAEESGVVLEAVQVALDYQQAQVAKSSGDAVVVPEEAPGPPSLGDQSVPVPPPVADEDASVPAPPAVTEGEEEPAMPKTRKKAPPKTKKKSASRKKATKKSPSKDSGKATKQTKPRTKKKPPKPEAEASANFPEAGAASPAAAPAQRPMGTSATRAKALDADNSRRAWHPKFDRDRFQRERKRSPLIRQLPEGYVLERRWPWDKGQGPIHRVVVCKDHYRYKGERYPTLYMVVKAITGTLDYKKQFRHDGTRPKGKRQLTTWSAARFFGLAKLVLTLADEKAGKGREEKLPKQPKRNLPRRKRKRGKEDLKKKHKKKPRRRFKS